MPPAEHPILSDEELIELNRAEVDRIRRDYGEEVAEGAIRKFLADIYRSREFWKDKPKPGGVRIIFPD